MLEVFFFMHSRRFYLKPMLERWREKILSSATVVSCSKRVALLFGLTITCWLTVPAPVQGEKLRVGVAGSAPFVIPDGSQFQGISLDIWKEIAGVQGFDYELIPQLRVQSGLEAVANGELDVLIGPISINSKRLRMKEIEFSQPMFYVQIGLVIPNQSEPFWSRIKPFFGLAALSSLFGLCLLLFVVGNLIWLVERHKNSQQFPPQYLSGVGNGMWLALTTLTTVGYGDCAPVTKAGRLITGIWMLLALLGFSSITAGLASAFTISLSELGATEKFTKAAELRGTRIAVVTGTSSVDWGKYYQVQLVETKSLKEAVELVVLGQVEGAIFDRPALEYYLRQEPKLDLRLAGFNLGTESYGFVMPRNNSIERNIDIVLVEMHQNKQIQAITENWVQPK